MRPVKREIPVSEAELDKTRPFNPEEMELTREFKLSDYAGRNDKQIWEKRGVELRQKLRGRAVRLQRFANPVIVEDVGYDDVREEIYFLLNDTKTGKPSKMTASEMLLYWPADKASN